MFGYHESDFTPLATTSDAVREWAWNVGAYPDNIGRQWLLSDYDSWERNPHYTGPNQGHPEDPDDGEDEAPDDSMPIANTCYPAGVPDDDDDIPF